jgi:predicted flap endonuclease-1-like 5' DNA nuclease
MSNEHWDPRTDELSHDITTGQTYGDSRHGSTDEGWPDHALYRTCYVDENAVLLKSNNWADRTNHRKYRQETRGEFEKKVGSGRYKLVADSADAPRMPDDLTEVRALASRLRDHYKQQDGRVNTHKADALAEFIEEMRSLEPDDIDVAAVSGVGPSTADALDDAGYTTDVSIMNAGVSKLQQVDGVGKKVAERLVERASS